MSPFRLGTYIKDYCISFPINRYPMRLVKQSTLYFKDGNSDKVYEVSLCDVGGDKFVVNFRYGRRGGLLKEGSKTPVPVSISEAERIYDALETEKLKKGYSATEDATPAAPRTQSFHLDQDAFPVNEQWRQLPAGRNKAILQRLHAAATGTATNFARNWKLSRVIWKAGEYHIAEALPYFAILFNKGGAMQQYSCAWAIARCRQKAAVPLLKQLYNSGAAQPSRIAGAALLRLLEGQEKEQHIQSYINALPEELKAVVLSGDLIALVAFLEERLAQQQVSFPWLTTLYLLSLEYASLRPVLKNTWQQLPSAPPFFKQQRAIFKLAELLDDFDTLGMLACKLEREKEMYFHQLTAEYAAEDEVFVSAIGEFIIPAKESKKANSRVAYSYKTRWYFHRRIMRQLKQLGNIDSADYVKLATGILVSYNRELDYRAHYNEHVYHWENNRYESRELLFPANAHLVFLHQILSANHPSLKSGGTRWQVLNPANATDNNKRNQTPKQQDEPTVLQKFVSFFTGKKKDAGRSPAGETQQNTGNAEPPQSSANKNGTPYLHLWNAMPQAYVQLLLQAQMNEVHLFAIENLSIHPDFDTLKTRFDNQIYMLLLLSPFEKPAEFGLSLVREKYAQTAPDPVVLIAMLNSRYEPARKLGMEWAENAKGALLSDADAIAGLLIASFEEVRLWAKSWLLQAIIDSDVKKAAAGKFLALILRFNKGYDSYAADLSDAINTSITLLGNEWQGISPQVLSDLLNNEGRIPLLFGLRLLQENKMGESPDAFPDSFLQSLLHHNFQPVREAAAIWMLRASDHALIQKQQLVINAYLSQYADIRPVMQQLAGRIANADRKIGYDWVTSFLPILLRKEPFEGLHAAVAELLVTELSSFLQETDKTTALNLLYSNYAEAQRVGVLILEKYIDPASLSIMQIIALGNHENIAVREWCWRLFTQQAARMRYEKESSIKLLDSKWDDTRRFAMNFFLEHFTEQDWSAEVLIGLADSVKPDIEAYGRELITRYFSSEHGSEYLLKLSQHPSEKMQLFATNFLERFATDDPQKLLSLEFYFRSVLTRVNKSRVAKKRIFLFLQAEGIKSEQAAVIVAGILTDISATMAIGDKAKCIEILLQLGSLFPVSSPLVVKETELRSIS